MDISEVQETGRSVSVLLAMRDVWAGKSPVCVGWIGHAADFPTAIPDPIFVEKLWLACQRPTSRFKSWQGCAACANNGPVIAEFRGDAAELGDGIIAVPVANNVIMFAPNTIWHAVVEHHYAPPAEFVQAIIAGHAITLVPVAIPSSREEDGGFQFVSGSPLKFRTWMTNFRIFHMFMKSERIEYLVSGLMMLFVGMALLQSRLIVPAEFAWFGCGICLLQDMRTRW